MMTNLTIVWTLILCVCCLPLFAQTMPPAPELTAAGGKLNVKNFGAVGDGIADDQQAILDAVAALHKQGSGMLYFPFGTYRTSKIGVRIVGMSNVTVAFDPGAILLMDNLDPKTKIGRFSHGIEFTGPATNIRLINATVKWKERPAKRSSGDGIRFNGYPSDEKTISHIQMLHCQVIDAPQTGAVIMGCSDVIVQDFRPTNTLADGLHFNACRRVEVNGVLGENTGDDTLALVTYFDPEKIGVYGADRPPFAQPTLGEWNNTHSTVTNVISRGGRANGIRVSGGKYINISNVSVERKGGGIQIDAARSNENPRTVGWSYYASRGINISNVVATHCGSGLLVRVLNIPPDMDDAHWRFDLTVSNVQTYDCGTWGVCVIDAAGVAVSNLKTNSPVLFRNARGDCQLSDATLQQAKLVIDGVQGDVDQGQKHNGEFKDMVYDDQLTGLKEKSLRFSNITVHNAEIQIRHAAGLLADHWQLIDSPATALSIDHCRNMVINPLLLDFQQPLSGTLPLIKVLKSRDILINQQSVEGAN